MKTHKEKQIEERGQQEDRLFGIDMTNPLDAIRKLVQEDGFTYEWQRYKLRDRQDSAYAFAIARGWEPIDKSKLPARYNLEGFEIYNPDPVSQKFICYGDLILMRRSNTLHEKEKMEKAEEARRSVEMADSYNYKSENPTLNVMKNN